MHLRNQFFCPIFKYILETKFCAIFSSACQKPNLASYFQAHCKNQILRHVSLASQKPNLCHIFKCFLEIKFCVIFSSASWKLNFAETKFCVIFSSAYQKPNSASFLKAQLRNQILRVLFKLTETKCCLNVVALATD